MGALRRLCIGAAQCHWAVRTDGEHDGGDDVRVSRVRIVFFGIALTAFVASVRVVLATHLGMFGEHLALVGGLLWLLYRAALSIALAAWG
jgi:hypothetical protein